MGYPSKRENRASGKMEQYGFATFNSVEDSVEDYLLWWKFHSIPFPSTAELAVSAMKKKSYFEDTYDNYIKGVNYWLNN